MPHHGIHPLPQDKLTSRSVPSSGSAHIAAMHAIISDQCRENRGDMGVISETSKRVQDSLYGLLKAWPKDQGVKLHVTVAVEYPPNNQALPEGGANQD